MGRSRVSLEKMAKDSLSMDLTTADTLGILSHMRGIDKHVWIYIYCKLYYWGVIKSGRQISEYTQESFLKKWID